MYVDWVQVSAVNLSNAHTNLNKERDSGNTRYERSSKEYLGTRLQIHLPALYRSYRPNN